MVTPGRLVWTLGTLADGDAEGARRPRRRRRAHRHVVRRHERTHRSHPSHSAALSGGQLVQLHWSANASRVGSDSNETFDIEVLLVA